MLPCVGFGSRCIWFPFRLWLLDYFIRGVWHSSGIDAKPLPYFTNPAIGSGVHPSHFVDWVWHKLCVGDGVRALRNRIPSLLNFAQTLFCKVLSLVVVHTRRSREPAVDDSVRRPIERVLDNYCADR